MKSTRIMSLVLAATFASVSFANESKPADYGNFELSITPEMRAKANEAMDQATKELKMGLEKLKPKYEAAKTEVEKSAYTQAAWLLVQNLFYRAEKIDLELAQKIPAWKNELTQAGYPVAGNVVQFGEPALIAAVAVSSAIGTVKLLIVGPFKAVLGAATSHFRQAKVGMIRKIVTSPIIPVKAIGNLFVLGTTIVVDTAIVYLAGEHVYAAIVSGNELDRLIKNKEEKISRTSAELEALNLFN